MPEKILKSVSNSAKTGALVGTIGTILVGCLVAKACADDTSGRYIKDCSHVLQLFMTQISQFGFTTTIVEILCAAAGCGATIGAGVGLVTGTYSFFKEAINPIEQGDVRRLVRN